MHNCVWSHGRRILRGQMDVFFFEIGQNGLSKKKWSFGFTAMKNDGNEAKIVLQKNTLQSQSEADVTVWRTGEAYDTLQW